MRRGTLKKVAALVSAFSLTLGAVSSTALAFDWGQSGGDSALNASGVGNAESAVVSLTANGGLLTHQAPADVNLGTIVTSTTTQTVTGTASAYTIDNARGYNSAAEPGWSVTATFSDMTSTNGTIDVTNFKVTPSNLIAVSGSSTNVSLGSQTTLSDANNDGTSDNFTWVTAAAGAGIGRYTSDLGILLTIPANTPAGDYSATVTITLT